MFTKEHQLTIDNFPVMDEAIRGNERVSEYLGPTDYDDYIHAMRLTSEYYHGHVDLQSYIEMLVRNGLVSPIIRSDDESIQNAAIRLALLRRSYRQNQDIIDNIIVQQDGGNIN